MLVVGFTAPLFSVDHIAPLHRVCHRNLKEQGFFFQGLVGLLSSP